MRFSCRTLIALVCVLCFLVSGTQADTQKPRVEMAILLDTSGSMEGLIEQAKTQLWSIVNELALSKRDDQSIELFVGLYEYGKSSIPKDEGHLRMIAPLTMDLDRISEELFKLKTKGGDEYCGTAIQAATHGLKWSENNDELKLIFIAGNEPFTQGQVDYHKACQAAIAKGIIVNTIFCGEHQEGIQTHWKDGADLADGKYMSINHNEQVAQIEAPQDKELTELGVKLNETYLGYGRQGTELKRRQSAQDSNALSYGAPAVMAQRAVTKASPQYSNANWDIVDAEDQGVIEVEKLAEAELPEELKKLDKKERKAYVEKLRQQRQKLQTKISELNQARRRYIAQQAAKGAVKTLDSAIIEAIREQAGKKNYTFEQPEPAAKPAEKTK